jgi:hypothetical protein
MRRLAGGAVVIGALSAGCARTSAAVEAPMISAEVAARAVATTTPASTAAARRRSAAPDAPFDRGDRFAGHYVCAQGRTELTLVIEDLDGDDVSAIFEFDYPGGGGANAPASGSFRMHGSFDARSRAVHLDGDRWIEQPDGYAMVGLVGTISKSGSIDGIVRGAGCSSFYLDAPRTRQTANR